MLLIIFWQVLMFFIAFLSWKQAKNEGELGIIHGKTRLKLNYMKNPSFKELQSLCEISQVFKEENQRRNLTSKKFRITFHHLQNFLITFLTCENSASPFTTCEIFATTFFTCEIFASPFPLAKFLWLHFSLAKSSCNLQIFCTDSVRFLP